MPYYKAITILEPAGSTSIAFKEPVRIEDIILRTDNSSQGNRPKMYAEFEFKSEYGIPQVRDYVYSEIIENKVLPVVILLSGSPYQVEDIKIEQLPEIYKRVNLVDTINMKEEVHIVKTLGNAQAEISFLLERLREIDPESKSILVRAIKYWNRGMSDPDPIDRFINLYIALELLKGHLLREEPSEKKRKWVKTLEEEYGFKKDYDGYRIHDIRAALLHYKNDRLSKEEAERIIERHVNEFAQEVFKLMSDYVKCRGDIECLQKTRQQRNHS